MKNIKRFNEALISNEQADELMEFAQLRLAYLIDNGITITIKNHHGFLHFDLGQEPKMGIAQSYSWDNIKDQFIPFLHLLLKSYKIVNNFGGRIAIDYFVPRHVDYYHVYDDWMYNTTKRLANRKWVSKEELLEDKIPLSKNELKTIFGIQFSIVPIV